ncbi:MAG TPA: hypothetical protein VJ548_10000 [Azospira sp.]|nr:hypothetical protein [Azospira sp.]
MAQLADMTHLAQLKMLARQSLPLNWQTLAKLAARAYVSGPELGDAMATAQRLSRQGLESTVCYWNVGQDSPGAIADACIAALGAARGEPDTTCVGVKLAPMRFDQGLLHQILDAANGSGKLIHFDAHGPETAEPTFRAIEQARGRYPHLGCTLPGRWQRSLSDAERAAELGLHVRVVKGQWPEQPERDDGDPRAGYLKVVDRLAGRVGSVAVATHDVALGQECLTRLRRAGTEAMLELLYGLPMKASLNMARAQGVPVRVYVPFGYGCLPYCLSQVRRNPRILWWILRDAVAGGALPSPAAPGRERPKAAE